ncbi:ribonuclease Y [Granulicoccus phenolivorans]|uniref:ribonuclease Y n=1 Tax=Granulicoccus phenolivorans TaxID=266854 RepID=UPI000423A35E|nr:ribonuclease Y [Granulicoccus phenolivorans]
MNVTEALLLTVLVVLVLGITGLAVLLRRRPRTESANSAAGAIATAEESARAEAVVQRIRTDLDAEWERLRAEEATLQRLRGELDADRARLTDTQRELAGRDTELTARDAELAGRDTELATRDADLTARDAELATRDADLTARTDRLATRARELDDRGRQLDARHEEVQSQEAVLRSRADEFAVTQERLRAEIDAERAELRRIRQDQDRRDDRLTGREDRLEAEQLRVTGLLGELDRRGRDLSLHEAEIGRATDHHRAELERIGGLSVDEARTELIDAARDEADRHSVVITREIETTARREGESRARKIIVEAIQRLASEQTAESVVSTVELPSDDMKGRIIGREGRNIRAFEQITGVNVMIDDTPGTVLISCFDPVRRETARLALTDLINDGRIQPVRIEEAYERAVRRIEERCLEAAEDACATAGIVPLAPDLMPILGSLQYRTSYGQNVLRHLVECAHLAGLMAGELGLDVDQCKRAAFLHDIGKALTHKVPGTHAIVGANLLRKYGEDPDIVHAVEAHHNEVEPHTVEAILTQACDAISGSRPGARRESLESYVERLERIEEIATDHRGVEKAFAMQAGREVRVMVAPEDVDEIGAQVIARDIAKQIEQELTYPGQIRVTVIRESRATEIAH